mgnify:CR=1 FL=1
MIDHKGIHTETFSYFYTRATNLLFVLTEEGKILEANTYAYNLTGQDLIGQNFADVIIDFGSRFDLAALACDQSKEYLISVANDSGLPQSFYFTFKPVSEFILAFGRLDAEELDSMRKEVLALNQDLNNLTRELHKKNAQLKQLNEEKNRFLGMTAHDLRKPIGLIITYSEFLIDEADNVLDSEQFGFLNTINESSTFMKRLVDDFLDISAIEAGRLELDLQPASINDVINKSLEVNRQQANKKKIDLQFRESEKIPVIQMDTPKIEQVITNLVSNAIEHSTPGNKVVVRTVAGSDMVTVSVQDFGFGISSEDMEKLFKPFKSTSAKKTGGEKSTGLGMMITRKIIDAHKGKIWVESKVGQGTTICFQLPLHQETQ